SGRDAMSQAARLLAALFFLAVSIASAENFTSVEQMCYQSPEHLEFCYARNLVDTQLVESFFLESQSWYCQRRPMNEWRRCHKGLGKCIPPDFEARKPCIEALP